MISTMQGFFSRQHGASKDAEKRQVAFTEGVLRALEPSGGASHQVEKRSGSRAFTGEFKVKIFAAMAAIQPLEGDADKDLEEPAAFSFYLDFEKRLAERMPQKDEKNAADLGDFVPLERAIDLLRVLFVNRRLADLQPTIVELEGLALLEEEMKEALAAQRRGEPFFRPEEDEATRRRTVAIVQNKVLRGLTRKGQS